MREWLQIEATTATTKTENQNDKMNLMNTPLQTLRAAFDKCANQTDWKAPIDFITSKAFASFPIEVYAEAISHFTATTAKITDLGNGAVRIQAAGYRKGPAW